MDHTSPRRTAGSEYADMEQLFPHWGAKLDVIDTHDWTLLHVIQSRLQSGKCSKTVIFESLIRNVAKADIEANEVHCFPLPIKNNAWANVVLLGTCSTNLP